MAKIDRAVYAYLIGNEIVRHWVQQSAVATTDVGLATAYYECATWSEVTYA